MVISVDLSMDRMNKHQLEVATHGASMLCPTYVDHEQDAIEAGTLLSLIYILGVFPPAGRNSIVYPCISSHYRVCVEPIISININHIGS